MVNIVLSSYNGEKYIKEQINSIISQTYNNWRLHIFDDGSTDSTLQIIDEYADKYKERIFVHHNPKNYGSTLSFLYGLKSLMNTADYYMFCDQDDVWLNDKIEVTLKYMMRVENKLKHGKPVLVFTDAMIVDSDLSFINHSFFKSNHLSVRKTGLNRILMENKCIGCTCMVNNNLVRKLIVSDKNIRFHDWWCALIAASFGTVKALKVPTILYRQHSNNQVGGAAFSSYVAKRVEEKNSVSDRLNSTYSQAEEFHMLYAQQLPSNKRKNIQLFTNLNKKSYFARRFCVLRKRYLKSGIIRNIGLLFYI